MMVTYEEDVAAIRRGELLHLCLDGLDTVDDCASGANANKLHPLGVKVVVDGLEGSLSLGGLDHVDGGSGGGGGGSGHCAEDCWRGTTDMRRRGSERGEELEFEFEFTLGCWQKRGGVSGWAWMQSQGLLYAHGWTGRNILDSIHGEWGVRE